MFTGLVAELGKITAITHGESSSVLTVHAPLLTPELSIGDSIAVNGTCLTATSLTSDSFTADVMVQTLSLTSLGKLEEGSAVNLELAAQMDMRMGGHIVQGHVDGTGTCIERFDGGDHWRFVFEFPREFAHLLIEKGSVCINGTSLTCFNVKETTFEVTIIPYTYHHTNFNQLNVNDTVNLEFDVIGKYLARFRELGQQA